jgi:hypothetical protein
MSWPADNRSYKEALTFKTLGEYCASLHVDALHALDEKHFPQPKVDKLIRMRIPFQNLQTTVQHWNDEILNCISESTRMCVNIIKHREVKVFSDKAIHEKHTTACYGHVAVKSAPPVILEDNDLEHTLPPVGPGGPRGRGRRP